MYLPAFPAIAASLKTDIAHISYSLPVIMPGYAQDNWLMVFWLTVSVLFGSHQFYSFLSLQFKYITSCRILNRPILKGTYSQVQGSLLLHYVSHLR